MAYNKAVLFESVRILLDREPYLRLTNISKALGVERHTIEKTMCQMARVSFRQYQQHLLLIKAMTLLTSGSNLSVKEIAVTLGYGSGQAFSRFIKRATGKTAVELRETSGVGFDPRQLRLPVSQD